MEAHARHVLLAVLGSVASAALSPSPEHASTREHALVNAPPMHKFALDAVLDSDVASPNRTAFEVNAYDGLTTLNAPLSEEWYVHHVERGTYFAFYGHGRMPSLGAFSRDGELLETVHRECEIVRLTADALVYLAEGRLSTVVLTHRAISRALKMGGLSLNVTVDKGGAAPTRAEWHAWLAENAYPIAGWGSEESWEEGNSNVDKSGEKHTVDGWNVDWDEKGNEAWEEAGWEEGEGGEESEVGDDPPAYNYDPPAYS